MFDTVAVTKAFCVHCEIRIPWISFLVAHILKNFLSAFSVCLLKIVAMSHIFFMCSLKLYCIFFKNVKIVLLNIYVYVHIYIYKM